MEFAEFSYEQRRQLTDAQQAFAAWREVDVERRHSCRGTMRWQTTKGRDYLYHQRRSLGLRSAETERIFRDFTEQKTRLTERLEALGERLDEMAPVNRAMRLGRVPPLAARILRKMDKAGFLGRNLFVVGTHALFAYEAASGVVFDSGLMATADLDLLWDARRRLSLALADVRAEGVIGLLKKVDHTFEARPGSFRAVNSQSYFVDLIRPLAKDEMRLSAAKVGEADDLEAAAIAGLEWLINTPKFEQIVIGADGRPLLMNSVDPRVFALHKLWVSQRADRQPLKRARDVAQAQAAAQVASRYLRLSFDAKELTAVPQRLRDAAPQLLAT